MPAQKHNPDLLVAILNRLVTHPHCEIKSTAREFKISPVTIFNWRAGSARDEQVDLKEASPFWVMWMDQASYWHRHLVLARKLSILRIDERLRDLAVNGTKEFLFRQGGEPIWQVDPATRGRRARSQDVASAPRRSTHYRRLQARPRRRTRSKPIGRSHRTRSCS